MPDIIESLKGLAGQRPEKTMQVIDDLVVKWSSMTDEQQAQAREQLAALKDKITTLTEDQRKAVTEKISRLM